MSFADKIFDYIASRPGLTYVDLSESLGLSRSHARHCLKLLEERGQIKAERRKRGTKAYFPADEATLTKAVIRRGNAIGHPFGILAAQVMT